MNKIYVAGPFSDSDPLKFLSNARAGLEAGAQLIADGYAVFCPFLDFQYCLSVYGGGLTKEQLQQNSLAWVDRSDAVLVLQGWEFSPGTEREIERAEQHGIPVFYNVYDMKVHFEG